MKIAGLDIGTSGCKCVVFDEAGKYLDTAYREYPARRKVTGHEIDASAIMDGVLAALREMAEKHPEIGGIGVTSFGETFVMTDAAGNPLHDAMLYTDPRGGEEVRELSDRLGERRIAGISGLRPHQMYSLPKLMWMKKHRPELYARAKHVFLMQDYVVFRLTGVAQIDYSLATRTMALDIRALEWSAELFEAAGVDMGLMSRPVPAGTPAGALTPAAAQAVGLAGNVTVVSVSHDQVAAAVGAGACDGSVAVDGAGTTQCLTPIYDSMPDIDEMVKGYYSVVPYVIPGKYVAYAFTYTGGALIDWCLERLARHERQEAAEQGISVYELLERRYTQAHGDAPSGLLVLPHFAGAATPYMDVGSRGAIVGLTMDTGPAEIYRACMEGVAYEIALNVRALRDSGIRFERLHATGGGARSAVWMQMKADVLNVPIVALRTANAGAVGSAMLTGIAVGAFRDLADAAAHMVERADTYLPRPEMHEEYMRVFERYSRLYDAVRPLV